MKGAALLSLHLSAKALAWPPAELVPPHSLVLFSSTCLLSRFLFHICQLAAKSFIKCIAYSNQIAAVQANRN